MTDINDSFLDPWIALKAAGKVFDPLSQQPVMLSHLVDDGGYNSTASPKHRVELFNMTDPDNMWMNLINSAVDGLINYEPDEEGNPPNDPMTPPDIKLNTLIESVSETGKPGLIKLSDLDLVVMNGTDSFTTHTLKVTEVHIGGLNTFTLANVLDPIEKYTLQNVFRLEKLSVEFKIELMLAPSTAPGTVITSANDAFKTEFMVQGFSGEGMEIDLKMLLTINKYLGAGLKLGSIFDVPLQCLPTALYGLNITYLNISMANFLPPKITFDENSGFVDAATTNLVNLLVDFAYASYGNLTKALLPMISQTNIKSTLMGILEDYMEGTCPEPEVYVTNELEKYVRFDVDDIIKTGLEQLNKNLLINISDWNSFIRQQTEGGDLTLVDNFGIHNVVPLGPTSELGLNISLYDAKLLNLDTFSIAELLVPLSAFMLSNRLEIANTDHPSLNKGARQLECVAHMNLTLIKNPNWPDAEVITNNWAIRMGMEKIVTVLILTIKADKAKIKGLRLREATGGLDIDIAFKCWYGTLEKTLIDYFSIRRFLDED